jgi:ribosomal protein L40E
MYDPQVYGLLGAVLLLHLGTLVYVYLRRDRDEGSPAADVDDAPVDRGSETAVDAAMEADETVVCAECGVRNAADYRFCRACVADLSGTPAQGGSEAFSNAA